MIDGSALYDPASIQRPTGFDAVSHLTRRWREMASNFQFRGRMCNGFMLDSVRSIIGALRKSKPPPLRPDSGPSLPTRL
jgi:hypothetical protein